MAYSGYIGNMKQPLEHPEVDTPTMYAIVDGDKRELDLIILSPSAFLHAYHYIKLHDYLSVKLFAPSIREEFVSDLYNLYQTIEPMKPIKIVFPEDSHHYDLSFAIEKTSNYIHTYDPTIAIEYIENPDVDHVYDIVVHSNNTKFYISSYLTAEKLEELYQDASIAKIHLPYSSTLYGGLSCLSAIELDRKYRSALIPHSYKNIAEYMYAMEHKF